MFRHWSDGQEFIFEDFNAIPKALLRTVYDQFAYELSQRKSSVFFADSLKVTFGSASSVIVKKGLGFMLDATVASPDHQYKPLVVDIDTTVNLPPPHATLPRKDLVCVKWVIENDLEGVRKFKSATTLNISTQTFAVQKKYTKVILIVEGTPNISPVAPAVPAGYLKIAELDISPVTGLANAAAIADSRELFPIGTSITASTLAFTRLTQSASITLNQLLAEIDALLFAGKQEFTDIKVLSSEPSNPATGYERFYLQNGIFYRKTSLGVALPVGSGGGGGGGGANWLPVSADGAVADVENNEKVFLFESGALQSISLFFKVPNSHISGRQLKLAIGAYSPSASGKFNLQLTSTLIKKNVDAMSATTNQNTNSVETTNTLANRYYELLFNVTAANGTINSVSVAAGDIIKLELKRIAATSAEDVADIRVIPSTTEVTV